MTQTETSTERDVHAEAQAIIEEMRSSVASGKTDWFSGLLAAVRQWTLPQEQVGERIYHYLVAGEAFDWLLLAERLAPELADFAPEDDIEALLFHEQFPEGTSETDLEQLLGAKYKAHLNFVYGCRVEAALQTAVGEEIRKERHATRIWERNGHADDEAFRRIYGRERSDLLAEFKACTNFVEDDGLSLASLSEWRYWLFQYRVRYCDPAKVASDTRKGLSLLQRLEHAARVRRIGSVEAVR
jgi:hypothetical protein